MPKEITVIGRRWFRRSVGSTYHSATILVDGNEVEGIAYAYGYGQQYLEHAIQKLEANGIVPKRDDRTASWQHCENLGIKLTYYAIDVQRKKDL